MKLYVVEIELLTNNKKALEHIVNTSNRHEADLALEGTAIRFRYDLKQKNWKEKKLSENCIVFTKNKDIIKISIREEYDARKDNRKKNFKNKNKRYK